MEAGGTVGGGSAFGFCNRSCGYGFASVLPFSMDLENVLTWKFRPYACRSRSIGFDGGVRLGVRPKMLWRLRGVFHAVGSPAGERGIADGDVFDLRRMVGDSFGAWSGLLFTSHLFSGNGVHFASVRGGDQSF